MHRVILDMLSIADVMDSMDTTLRGMVHAESTEDRFHIVNHA